MNKNPGIDYKLPWLLLTHFWVLWGWVGQEEGAGQSGDQSYVNFTATSIRFALVGQKILPPLRHCYKDRNLHWRWKWKWSRSVVPNSLRPRGLWSTRLLCPWDFPAKSTRMGCHFLLQRIFPIQKPNPGLLHCRHMLYHPSHQESWKSPPGTLKEKWKKFLTIVSRNQANHY